MEWLIPGELIKAASLIRESQDFRFVIYAVRLWHVALGVGPWGPSTYKRTLNAADARDIQNFLDSRPNDGVFRKMAEGLLLGTFSNLVRSIRLSTPYPARLLSEPPKLRVVADRHGPIIDFPVATPVESLLILLPTLYARLHLLLASVLIQSLDVESIGFRNVCDSKRLGQTHRLILSD